MPQDVKLSPDGKVFYVADMRAERRLDDRRRRSFSVIGFIRTGAGAHGLYPSRDARCLYVTNRGEGSISRHQLRARARSSRSGAFPAAAAPTWAASRPTARCCGCPAATTRVVYAISHAHGQLLARIRVGAGPHGLCVWPQPGRYSLGHTGVLR